MVRISYIGTKAHEDLLKDYLPSEDKLVEFCMDQSQPKCKGKECSDVVFISMNQEESNGIDIMHQLRERIIQDQLQVIFITDPIEEYLQVEILKAGANDIMILPIGKRLFQHKLQTWKQSVNCCNDILQECGKGDLEFSKEKYAVKSSSGEITLSKREYEILSLLDSVPDKVFSRNEIKEEVWGNSDIHERTIDVYVKKLRDLLGESRIKTISGFGYKLSR